jgi:PAS domain S-box-containing protein
VGAGIGAVHAVRFVMEHDYQVELETEAKRRALEVTTQTMNGNVMGSVASLGLISQPVKRVAKGELPLQDPVVMDTLEAVGKSYGANGVYIVNKDGIIQSCWYTVGVTLTGVDVNFRPYFRIAMRGKENVYAAIGTTTGLRSLYFASPLYAGDTTNSPIIGATVGRLGLERVDSVLKSWSGPALLLSPQDVAFASNREEWIARMAGAGTPERMKAIRALKQFGKVFDSGTPAQLPFDLKNGTVRFDNQRYALAHAPVDWNDPNGEWKVVLLGDLDALMSVSTRMELGTAAGALVMAVCALFLSVRRRLRHAHEERDQAEEELKEYAHELESETSIKSYLAEISPDLQRATSMTDLARKFLFHVTRRLTVDYAVLYILNKEGNLLVPVGGHGVLPQHLEKLKLGQGLVGQCAQDVKPIEILDAAEESIRIQWGAGELRPKWVLLLPIVQSERLLGVVVLASLSVLDHEQRALLDAMMPMLSMNLEILERNVGTQRLAENLQQQQAHLLETEAWYRGILESAPDGMLVADAQGVIILTNTQIDTMFGYSPGALIGQKMEILVPVDARAMHVGLRERYMLDGSPRAMGDAGMDLRGIRQDGTEFPVDIGLSRLPALGNRGMCVCASVRDITERKLAEEATAEERARLQLILDTSPVNVAFTAKGRFQFLNPLFAETFGVKLGDAANQIYAHEKDREDVLDRLKRDGMVRNLEIQMIDAKKHVRDMLITFLPLAYGNDDGVLGWLVDITERKQAERELQERMEDLERFSRLTIDREGKMIQLKEEINALLEQLGKERKYKIVE